MVASYFFTYLCPRLFSWRQCLAFAHLEFLGLVFGVRRPYSNRPILPASFVMPLLLPYVPGAVVFLHVRQPRCRSVQAGRKTTAPDTSLRPVCLPRPKKWSFNFCPGYVVKVLCRCRLWSWRCRSTGCGCGRCLLCCR
uniref:Uncharacterized protein n=1 Tax=Ixodes ricinus TaxID=34613 RepID=A0A6B0USJ6_IXORI